MTWFLLWPDLHRLVIVSFQDTRADIKNDVGSPYGAEELKHPEPEVFTFGMKCYGRPRS